MPDLETRDVRGVEVLAPGTWNGDPYTSADLDAMVAAFYELRGKLDPPGKLGHDGEQKLAQRDGYPAIGWVTKLYRVGEKLVADFTKVPAKVAALIQAGAYNKVSSEVYFDLELGGKVYSRVLKAVAFLGADIPAVKDIHSIGDVAALYAEEFAAAEPHFAEYTDVPESKRQDMPAGDFVFPETRDFPVMKASDIARAVSSWGRYRGSESFDSFKRKLIALAKRKGWESSLPKEWDVKENAEKDKQPNVGQDPDGDGDAAGDTDGDGDGAAEMTAALEEFDTYCRSMEQRISGKKGAKRMRTFLSAARRELAGMRKPPFATNTEADMDIKVLAEALGLPESADEAAVLAAIKERPKTAELSEVRELRDQVGTLTAELAERKAGEAVDSAMRDGKIVPAQRDWALDYARKDPAGFKTYAEKAPRIAQLASPVGSDSEGPEGAKELTDDEQKLARQLHVSPESMLRSKSRIPTDDLARETRKAGAA